MKIDIREMPRRKALLQGGCGGVPDSGIYERNTVTDYNVKPRVHVKKSY